MEIWDKAVRDNLYGSAFLRTWENLPYAFKEIIVESIAETLKPKDKEVTEDTTRRHSLKMYSESYKIKTEIIE